MGNDKVICIRTDGNKDIATGHIGRCITIARSLQKLGATVHFVISDTQSEHVLQQFFTTQDEFEYTILDVDYRDLQANSHDWAKVLRKCRPSWILLDSYFATEQYMEILRGKVKLAYIDDLMKFQYPADLIINYDLDVEHTSKQKVCYQLADKKLLGLKYTPLREGFGQGSIEVKDIVQNVLIATGGTDPYGLAIQILQRMVDASFLGQHVSPRIRAGIRFHVVVGAYSDSKSHLETMAKLYSGVILHENVKDMPALMKQCDLAVSAAGTMLYELCALGVPSISYSIAKNQIEGAKAFDKAGLVPYIGHYPDMVHSEFLENLRDKMEQLCVDASMRRQMSEMMHQSIDGMGSDRIAKELLMN